MSKPFSMRGDRLARQAPFFENTPEKLNKEEAYRNLRILILGGGTVGTALWESLLRSGAATGENGYITIVEGDNIAETNLGRLLNSTRHKICRSKAESLNELASGLRTSEYPPNYTVIKAFAKKETLGKIIDHSNPDIIFEAVDQLSVKAAANIEAYKRRIPVFLFTDLGADTAIKFFPNNNSINGKRYGRKGKKLLNGIVPKSLCEYISKLNEEKEYTEQGKKYRQIFTFALVGLTNVSKDMFGAVAYMSENGVNTFPQEISAVGGIIQTAPRLTRQFAAGEKIPLNHLHRGETWKNSFTPYIKGKLMSVALSLMLKTKKF